MNRKPSLLVIFLTVFIDLVGFGIVLPLMPIFVTDFGFTAFYAGVIAASFSAMQFLFSPFWGRLSDRIGRRPVLLVSTAFAVASYVVFALGSGLTGNTAFWIILGSRIVAGICGANITVAQAYIADITPREHRSKRMGLIGVAFGLGFIFGPAIGGISMHGIKSIGWAGFGPSGPGWVAAALCAVNFLLAFALLPESRPPGAAHTGERPRLTQWLDVLRRPTVGLLVVIFFLATFCFTTYELTLGWMVAHSFGFDPIKEATTITTLFVFCGIVGVFVQGGPIGKLVKRYGEPKLIAVSLIILGLSFAAIPFIHGQGRLSWAVLFSGEGLAWWGMLIALGSLSVGAGLTRPPLFGMLSMLTSADEQGETLGVAQGAGSLARIPGPLFAGYLFQLHPAWPYFACAVLALLTGLIAWIWLIHPPPTPLSTSVGQQP